MLFLEVCPQLKISPYFFDVNSCFSCYNLKKNSPHTQIISFFSFLSRGKEIYYINIIIKRLYRNSTGIIILRFSCMLFAILL